MLKGKIKKEFEKWILENLHDNTSILYPIGPDDVSGVFEDYESFEQLPIICQTAIILDWFRSDEIRILIDISRYMGKIYAYDYKYKEREFVTDLSGSDPLYYNHQAIDLAVEVYNYRDGLIDLSDLAGEYTPNEAKELIKEINNRITK